MEAINLSCTGESHIRSGRVCQDASFCLRKDGLVAGIVSDGHGGDRYFRSDIGAQKAIESTLECINDFLADPKSNPEDAESLKNLFSDIVRTWKDKVSVHASRFPVSDRERVSVNEEYLRAFAKDTEIVNAYGCTLVCSVQVTDYWLAFQIGDGNCISFDEDGLFCEKVPWDDHCFLNLTTSLCDKGAESEFRYFFSRKQPVAVFLSTDGVGDSFGSFENLTSFYRRILNFAVENGAEKLRDSLSEDLPMLSKLGSKDDMSLVCVYDDVKIKNHETASCCQSPDK